MKCVGRERLARRFGPAPQGAGGLKSFQAAGQRGRTESRPARGGWIEISLADYELGNTKVPPRKGRVD